MAIPYAFFPGLVSTSMGLFTSWAAQFAFTTDLDNALFPVITYSLINLVPTKAAQQVEAVGSVYSDRALAPLSFYSLAMKFIDVRCILPITTAVALITNRHF